MDVLGCVVNIDSTQVILPMDKSFNESCETLAMQQQNYKQPNYSTNNGLLSTHLTENTLLHPNTTQNEYSSLLSR